MKIKFDFEYKVPFYGHTFDIHGTLWKISIVCYDIRAGLCRPCEKGCKEKPMCQIKCPVCKRRICDIITTANEQVTIEIKCPHCRRIVRIEWLLRASIVKN